MNQTLSADALADGAAAAPPQPLAVGGTVYLISPPTDADMQAIALQVIRSASTPLAKVVNDPAYLRLPTAAQIAVAVEAGKMQVDSAGHDLSMMEYTSLLARPAALAFAIWLLARHNHPDLTLEDLTPHISEDNAIALFVAFNEASGMAALAREKNSAGPPG